MVCGTSSSFIQVTVVPAFTVMRWGRKANWSISTSASAAAAAGAAKVAAAAKTAAASAVAMRISGLIVRMTAISASALQGLVDDGEPLLPASECHVGDAEHRAQLIVGDLQRSR